MMTRFLFLIAVCLSTALARGQTFTTNELGEIVFHNQTSLTNYPPITADVFVNDGLFEVQNLFAPGQIAQNFIDAMLTPYDFTSLKKFTNNGTMQGLAIRYDNVDDFAVKTPMDSWVNTVSGRIDFADGFHYGTFVQNQAVSFNFWYSPYSNVRINSRRIENQGLIRIGAGGLLRLGETNSVDGSFEATDIDLKNGILAVDPVGSAYGTTNSLAISEGFVRAGSANYLNPLGIYDIFWGVGTQTNQDASTLFFSVNPNVIISPEFTVQDEFGFNLTTTMFLTDAQAFGFVNTVRNTNIYIHAVFVQTANTNIQADVRWYPIEMYPNVTRSRFNDFWTPFLRLSAVVTNALTLQPEVNSLYLWDQLGPATNTVVIDNDKFPFFRRPSNYFVSRQDYGYYSFGELPNLDITPGIFYQIGYSNQIVTNFYSAYAFNMENLVYQVPNLPDVGVKDLPGRIEIKGRNVDLTEAGIRGEGLISISASNLLSTASAVVDAQNLMFNLQTTGTNVLRFENLAKQQVSRFHGPVQMWSGTFTNQVGDANSNVFNLLYHVWIVDATAMSALQEVSVAGFQAQAETVSIFDSMIVSNRFSTTASNLNVAGNVELRNVAWNSTNMPNVRNITIEPTGSLTLQGLAEFGTVSKPLSNYVNRGTVASYSQSIVADNVEIYGEMLSAQNLFFLTFDQFGVIVFTNFLSANSGPLYVQANRSARLEGGEIGTGGSVFLNGPLFKLSNFEINSGAAINISVTNIAKLSPEPDRALQDSGVNAGNVFHASNAFSLNLPVPIGNLLGTEIHGDPAPRGVFQFRWAQPAPADLTITNIPTAANWSSETNRVFNVWKTNTALGLLSLHSTTNSIFEFRGTAQNRALFVDLIEIDGTGITNLTTLLSSIRLIRDASTSIDIYYGDIVATNLSLNLGFQTLAEFFNGRQIPAGGGTFRWVPSFNGPRTSEDVVSRVVVGGVTNSVTVRMNRALRHSQIIDMDGDGIANANDDLPLRNEVGAIAIANISFTVLNGQVAVQFAAYPGTYTLQAANSLSGSIQWIDVASYQHTSAQASMKTLTDSSAAPDGRRFYRLIYRQ